MKTEENIEKKLYIPPDFYVLDFKETLNGNNQGDAEDDWIDTYSGPEV